MMGSADGSNEIGPRRRWWQRTWARIVGLVTFLAALAGIYSAFFGNHVTVSQPPAVPDTTPRNADGTCGDPIKTGWGPDRSTFSINAPAPYATLNSITDNPSLGNEVMFIDVKSADHLDAGGWCSDYAANDGDVLIFRVCGENSAADNLTQAVAEDTRVLFRVDGQPSTLVTVEGSLTSSTTSPQTVYSRTEVTAPRPFRLDWVRGSETLYSNPHPQGITLTGTTSGSGALVGPEPDGRLVPGYENSFIVTIKARITFVG